MISFAKQILKISVIQLVKKVFSISLVILMLTAMLHLTVATHYCGGKVAASRVSFSGKLATCGMECSEKDYPLQMPYLDNHCCDDVITFYIIDSNYSPSFSLVPESYQYNFQVFSIQAGYPVYSIAVLRSLYTNVSPPEALMSTNVDLSNICVFRI